MFLYRQDSFRLNLTPTSRSSSPKGILNKRKASTALIAVPHLHTSVIFIFSLHDGIVNISAMFVTLFTLHVKHLTCRLWNLSSKRKKFPPRRRLELICIRQRLINGDERRRKSDKLTKTSDKW